MRRGPRTRAAFTLLEVMAAVLVLGLLYAVLAEAAIRGLRSEGVSRRRVEASLIADLVLAELEEQIILGKPPQSGSEEETIDVYRVVRAVQPFDPTPILEAIEAVEEERGTPTRKPRLPGGASRGKPAADPGGSADAPSIQDLLAPPRTGEDGRLRRIDVSVAWQDGDREESVRRTTFAFDTSGLESLFPKKDAAAQDAGGAAGSDGVSDLQDLPPDEAGARMQEIMEQLGAER